MSKFRNSAAERSSSFGFFLFFCLIFSFLSFCPTAQGATYTVTNTDNSGAGSLRQAITSANTNPGPDTIIFSIPGCGVACTIHPLTPFTLNTLNGRQHHHRRLYPDRIGPGHGNHAGNAHD